MNDPEYRGLKGMKKTIFAVMLVIGLIGVALQVAYANNSMVHVDLMMTS